MEMLTYMHVFMQVFVLVERISKETAAMAAGRFASLIILIDSPSHRFLHPNRESPLLHSQ